MDELFSISICLVCGSLEPHKDGVGDYCRTLAIALRQRGATVTLLGLCDKYVEGEPYSDPEILRLPATWTTKKRYARAADAISGWAPDWISLQFVNWNFGWKGIVTNQAKMLGLMTHNRLLHIMFHETWVGGAPEILPSNIAKFRRGILGRLQKASLHSMARNLNPRLVHASNLKYQQSLGVIGIKALQMPMFGSIELAPRVPWTQVRELLGEATGKEFPANRSDVILLGIFGAVRRCPVEEALTSIFAAAPENKRVFLISFGAVGPFGTELLRSWQLGIPGLEIVTTGPLDAQRLSVCFQELDAAVSLHPACVIGRSSAVAALLEHGVPVICPWGQLPSEHDEFVKRWVDLLHPVNHAAKILSTRPSRSSKKSWSNEAASRLLLDIQKASELMIS